MKLKNLLLITVLLIIVGCGSQAVKKTTPPPFLLNELNIQRIEQYNAILNSSPIPVFLMDPNELPESLKVSIRINTLGKLFGLYIRNNKEETLPNEFIFININYTPETVLITFFHEYQHYQCAKTNCYCMGSEYLPKEEQIIFSALREKHAMENELRQALKLKDYHLIQNAFISISNYILYSQECTYKLAAISVVGGGLWDEAAKIISKTEEEKLKKVR